jgi:hypothetical protein
MGLEPRMIEVRAEQCAFDAMDDARGQPTILPVADHIVKAVNDSIVERRNAFDTQIRRATAMFTLGGVAVFPLGGCG